MTSYLYKGQSVSYRGSEYEVAALLNDVVVISRQDDSIEVVIPTASAVRVLEPLNTTVTRELALSDPVEALA